MVAMWCLQFALVALFIAMGASFISRRAKKPQPQETTVGKLTLDLECDPSGVLKALDEVRARALEVERTFDRIEMRSERVVGAVREHRHGGSERGKTKTVSKAKKPRKSA